VIESVHCPKCATHYALRPPRVHRRHRRAKCFTCDHVFPIAEEVQRLLATKAPGDYAAAPLDGFSDQSMVTAALEAQDLGDQNAATAPISREEIQAAFLGDAIATMEGPLVLPDATETFSEGPLTYLPPLTLHDLEEPDSAMEKTLVLPPGSHPEHRPFGGLPAFPTHSNEELEALGMGGPPPMPESLAESAPGTVREMSGDGTSTYSSARDAIDKLMAGTPSLQRSRPVSMGMRGGAPMDIETTLDALDLTLGGGNNSDFDAAMEAASTSVLSPKELDLAMSAQTAEPEPSAPTQFMPIEDISLGDPSPQAMTLMMPLPAAPPAPSAPTVTMAAPMLSQMTTPMHAHQSHEDAVKDPNLLKIQLESETLSNVAMDQLIHLVEQGRVKEYHLVARQFSENWLEANKVPALRPVFERLRAITRIGPAPTLANETAPVKKSLFGGLFGSKN